MIKNNRLNPPCAALVRAAALRARFVGHDLVPVRPASTPELTPETLAQIEALDADESRREYLAQLETEARFLRQKLAEIDALLADGSLWNYPRAESDAIDKRGAVAAELADVENRLNFG